MNNQKTHSFIVRPSECDLNRRITPQAAAERMEEIAWFHAEELGFGIRELIKIHAFWALTRLTIRFERLPKLGDEIKLQTWPKTMSGLLALRDWLWFDYQNKVIGRATSSWVLVDMDSRKPRNLDDVPNIDFERYPESALDEMPGKIHRPEEGQTALNFKVPLSDLDLNGHVNNTKYFRWILNAFSQQSWKSNWKQIEANYLGEALPAEEIELIRAIANHEAIIEAHSKVRDKTLFRSRILFKE